MDHRASMNAEQHAHDHRCLTQLQLFLEKCETGRVGYCSGLATQFRWIAGDLSTSLDAPYVPIAKHYTSLYVNDCKEITAALAAGYAACFERSVINVHVSTTEEREELIGKIVVLVCAEEGFTAVVEPHEEGAEKVAVAVYNGTGDEDVSIVDVCVGPLPLGTPPRNVNLNISVFAHKSDLYAWMLAVTYRHIPRALEEDEDDEEEGDEEEAAPPVDEVVEITHGVEEVAIA